MSEPPPQRTIDQMRWLFDAAWVATAVAFVVLTFFPDRTERIFAWTITPPITSVWLGAGYASGLVLVAMGRRERVWAKVRVGYVSVLVFSTLALIATVIHVDRFQFTSGGAAGFAAWAWLFVYLTVPTAMVFLLFRQLGEPGEDPPVVRAIPAWMAAALGAAGAVLVLWGAGLFVAPASVSGTWPWPLTPLTSRMTAAWLIALGVTALVAIRERDLARLRAPCAAMLAYGAWGSIAVLTRRVEMTGSAAGTVVLVATIVGLTLVSAIGLTLSRRAEDG